MIRAMLASSLQGVVAQTLLVLPIAGFIIYRLYRDGETSLRPPPEVSGGICQYQPDSGRSNNGSPND